MNSSRRGIVALWITVVILLLFLSSAIFSVIVCRKSDRETVEIDRTQVSDSVVEMPAYCHDVIPESYIRRYSYAKDIMVGDTAWVTYLRTDSLGNAWLYKEEDIWPKKECSKVIRITRDSIGYVADLRFCDKDRFSISNYSKDDFAYLSFPIYCVITDFPPEQKK